MTNPTILDISLWYDCPACGETLDLFDEKDCWETGSCQDEVLAWSMLKTWLSNYDLDPVEGTCGRCKQHFIVEKIEY